MYVAEMRQGRRVSSRACGSMWMEAGFFETALRRTGSVKEGIGGFQGGDEKLQQRGYRILSSQRGRGTTELLHMMRRVVRQIDMCLIVRLGAYEHVEPKS